LTLSTSWLLTIAVFLTVSVLWGSFIWWLCNHSLSMTVERILANNYEKQLHKLSKVNTHPLDKKFFALYIDQKNGNITLFKMPWADKSILMITYIISLLTCILPLISRATLSKMEISFNSFKDFFAVIIIFSFVTFIFCVITRYFIKKNIEELKEK